MVPAAVEHIDAAIRAIEEELAAGEDRQFGIFTVRAATGTADGRIVDEGVDLTLSIDARSAMRAGEDHSYRPGGREVRFYIDGTATDPERPDRPLKARASGSVMLVWGAHSRTGEDFAMVNGGYLGLETPGGATFGSVRGKVVRDRVDPIIERALAPLEDAALAAEMLGLLGDAGRLVVTMDKLREARRVLVNEEE